jgi:uncharacterized protein (DUF433 family)
MNATQAATVTDTIPMWRDDDGVIRIAQTRVTLDTIVQAFQDGATAEEIAQQYPVLALGDIYSVIGYYLHRRSEVDAYLSRRRQEAEDLRRNTATGFDPIDIRTRLLARRAAGIR